MIEFITKNKEAIDMFLDKNNLYIFKIMHFKLQNQFNIQLCPDADSYLKKGLEVPSFSFFSDRKDLIIEKKDLDENGQITFEYLEYEFSKLMNAKPVAPTSGKGGENYKDFHFNQKTGGL